jgi:hypothetical protein
MTKQTLYQHATVVMKVIIDKMIQLSEETYNFNTPLDKHWDDIDSSIILLRCKWTKEFLAI